ncbi:MAG: PAS domain S-box protein [Hydrogenophaga sp.]|nr:PAS domain S-box protein [Hydrogenophaga sp.]
MMIRRPPLHRWWSLLPAVIAAVLLGLLIVATERIVADELTRRSLGRVEQFATIYADQIARLLSQRASEMALLARTVDKVPERAGADPVRDELQRLKDSSTSIVWLGWVDPEGMVVAGSDRLLEGLSIATRPVYLNGRAGRWFGSLHPSVALKAALERKGQSMSYELADLALPVRRADGSLRGVLAMHIDGRVLEQIRHRVLGPVDDRRTMDLALVTPGLQTLVGRVPSFAADDWARRMPDGAHQPVVMRARDGVDYAATHSKVETGDPELAHDWSVVGHQDLRAALEPASEMERLLLVWGGLAALVLGGLGAWATRQLTRPYVQVFDAVAERLADPGRVRPAESLDAMLEQVRRLPASALAGSPSDRLLAQVLHDAGRIKVMLDLLPAPVYLVDNDYRLVYWNHSAAEVFGWRGEDVLGQPLAHFLKWTDPYEDKRQRMAMLESQEGPWAFEIHAQRRDGIDIWGEWRVSRLRDMDGSLVGMMAQVRDLTAEREARQRLTEQSETLTAIIQASSDAVISTDASGRIELFNPAAERIFQVAAADLMGQPLDRLLPPRFRPGHHQHLRGFADSSTSRRRMGAGRVVGLRADGAELELEASISQVTVRGRKVLTAILRDVTERVLAERRQAQYQLELSELTYQLMEQEKQTTRRLAQILHDRLGQTLTALRLSLDALGGTLGDGLPAAAAQRMAKLDALAQQAIHEVRQAMMELRPPLLEDNGLAAALETECHTRQAEAPSVPLHLRVQPGLETLRWPADVEHAVFMVAREALVNAIQHAQARQIEVRLDGDAQHIHLEVADDGVGMPLALSQGRPGHLGMVGMRERALAIGAALVVEPQAAGGTLVRLDWELLP